MKTHQDRRRELEDRLKEIDWKLVEIEDVLDQPKTLDTADRATEREADEVLERLGVSGQQEEAMIRAALDRIKAGVYGICTKCGGNISQDRLDLVPHTPVCKFCAR